MKHRKFKLNQKGQGLVEYLILVCLIAVSAIAVVSVVGQNIRARYANISNTLRGHRGNEVQLETIDAQAYQQRGMDDFLESAHAPGGQ